MGNDLLKDGMKAALMAAFITKSRKKTAPPGGRTGGVAPHKILGYFRMKYAEKTFSRHRQQVKYLDGK